MKIRPAKSGIRMAPEIIAIDDSESSSSLSFGFASGCSVMVKNVSLPSPLSGNSEMNPGAAAPGAD